MEIGLLPKLRFARAAEAVAGIELSDEARALPSASGALGAFLKELVGAGLHADAIRVLAMALPKREAVWWACLMARSALPAENDPNRVADELKAIGAAEDWVYRPDEERRRAAYAPAEALNFETAGAQAALAAFWSDGSLAPPDAAVIVPPAEHLTHTIAAAAVMIAAAAMPEALVERRLLAVEKAVDIANGGNGKRPASLAVAPAGPRDGEVSEE